MKKFQYLLFDLDGTLTDPKQGLTSSLQYALEKLNAHVPSCDELTWCIGPPLKESFPVLLNCQDEAIIEQAVNYYIERYTAGGLFENQVYVGIPELLATLRELNYSLFVATTKLTTTAQRILRHFDLAQYFEGIYGSEPGGVRADKRELLQHILEQETLEPHAAMMIGDRKHDVLGAKHNGLKAGGITYGYGSLEELTNAGADHFFHQPEDILQFLRSAE